MAVRKYSDGNLPQARRQSTSIGSFTPQSNQFYDAYVKRVIKDHNKYFGSYLKINGLLSPITNIDEISYSNMPVNTNNAQNTEGIRVVYLYRGLYITLVFRQWQGSDQDGYSHGFTYYVSGEVDENLDYESSDYCCLMNGMHNNIASSSSSSTLLFNDLGSWSTTIIPNFFYEDDKTMWLLYDLGRTVVNPHMGGEMATHKLIGIDYVTSDDGSIDYNDIVLLSENDAFFKNKDLPATEPLTYTTTLDSIRSRISCFRLKRENQESPFKFVNTINSRRQIAQTFDSNTDANGNLYCYDIIAPIMDDLKINSLEGFVAVPTSSFPNYTTVIDVNHKGVLSKFMVPKILNGSMGILKVDKATNEYQLALKWNDG